jgi:uncharacterized protein YheU (UPF0270 family)
VDERLNRAVGEDEFARHSSPLGHGGGFHIPQYTESMHVPHTQLSSAALRAVVEEFVTRDGTDHSAVERRIAKVLHQLNVGRVELHFDQETRTCNFLPVKDPLTGGQDE